MIKLAMTSLVPETHHQGNLVSVRNEGIDHIIAAAGIRPNVISFHSLSPSRTLTDAQLKVAATNGAYLLATYDAVIVYGLDARNIMREAEKIYTLGEWTWIPHPDKINPLTNKTRFYAECADIINNLLFRVVSDAQQTRREVDNGSLAKLFEFRRT